jgi:hypothetical protein
MSAPFSKSNVLGIWAFNLMMTAGYAWAAETETTTRTAAESINHAIWIAAIGAVVSGLGWIAAYFLNGRRDDRTKRIQLTIDHTSTQLSEFYDPLVALTQELAVLANDVKGKTVCGKTEEDKHAIDELFYNDYFLPLHQEITKILYTKVHLAEGELETFPKYFEHYAAEKAYWDLIKKNQDVSNLHPPGYPSEFNFEVRRGRDVVRERYEASIKELRHRPWLDGVFGITHA